MRVTLRHMIDSGALNVKEDPKKASPLTKHVSDHMQDPVGATKEGFSNLSQKKMDYDLAKEEMMRELLPVKSVIQHVEQMHDLNRNGVPDELENNPDLNPAAQPMGSMANKFAPDQGIPPNMVRQPGFGNTLNKPNANQNLPGAGPQKPVADVRQTRPAAPQAKKAPGSKFGLNVSPANQSKLDRFNRPGMQQPKEPSRKVRVVVGGNEVRRTRMDSAMEADKLRSSNTACEKGMRSCSDTKRMRAGGPGSGRRPMGTAKQSDSDLVERTSQKHFGKKFSELDTNTQKRVLNVLRRNRQYQTALQARERRKA